MKLIRYFAAADQSARYSTFFTALMSWLVRAKYQTVAKESTNLQELNLETFFFYLFSTT